MTTKEEELKKKYGINNLGNPDIDEDDFKTQNKEEELKVEEYFEDINCICDHNCAIQLCKDGCAESVKKALKNCIQEGRTQRDNEYGELLRKYSNL